MQLKVTEFKVPGAISFNFDELKTELAEKLAQYETVIYTEDQMKTAKADRADLNRLKKALNDERLRREREFMKPFDEFKRQINEIIAMIDKPVAAIDAQIKAAELERRIDKQNAISEMFQGMDHPEWLNLHQIFSERWLNATFKMDDIREEIANRLDKVDVDITTLESLPAFSVEAIEVYKETLDINKAIAEGDRLARIQRIKAERETQERDRIKITSDAVVEIQVAHSEAVEDDEAQWIDFSVLMTKAQAKELRSFLLAHGMRYRKVQR